MDDWNVVKLKLKDLLSKIKKNPIMDAAVKAAIIEVPFFGNFLVNLYEKMLLVLKMKNSIGSSS
jgi:hypothetical protein